MNKEIAKKQDTSLEVPSGAWGTENLKSENILIPQIYLMQGQSRAVQEGKAKPGDILESVDFKILGSQTQNFEFIPIDTFDTFMLQVLEGDEWKFLRTEAVTPANVHHKNFNEWNSIDPETKKRLKWTYELKFYVLPAGNFFNTLPHVLGFRSTSLKAGRGLTNHFLKCKGDNIPAASFTIKLRSNKVTKNNKTYSVYELERGEATTKEQLAIAYKWYKTIKSGAAKVHEASGLDGTESVEDDLDV